MARRKTIDQEHEDWVALITGGRRSPSSGAEWTDRGDIQWSPYLISCKATANESISVKRKDWYEIMDNAYERSKTPGMALRMINDNGVTDLILIEIHDFIEGVKRGSR